jgi:hypothetical protein
MRYGARAFLAGSLGFAVAFVVACGSGNGLLSGNQASTLNAELTSISNAIGSRDCTSAQAAANRFSSELANLPKGVSTTLINNLDQGILTVGALAQRACSSSSSTSSTSSSSSSTTNPTSSTSSSPSSSSSSSSATNTSSSGTSSNGGAGLTTGGGGGGGGGGAGASGANQNAQ